MDVISHKKKNPFSSQNAPLIPNGILTHEFLSILVPRTARTYALSIRASPKDKANGYRDWWWHYYKISSSLMVTWQITKRIFVSFRINQEMERKQTCVGTLGSYLQVATFCHTCILKKHCNISAILRVWFKLVPPYSVGLISSEMNTHMALC